MKSTTTSSDIKAGRDRGRSSVEAVLEQVRALRRSTRPVSRRPPPTDWRTHGHITTPLLQLSCRAIWTPERSRASQRAAPHDAPTTCEGVEHDRRRTSGDGSRRARHQPSVESRIDAFDHLVTPSGGKIAESDPGPRQRGPATARGSSSAQVLDRPRPSTHPATQSGDLRAATRRFRRYEIFRETRADDQPRDRGIKGGGKRNKRTTADAERRQVRARPKTPGSARKSTRAVTKTQQRGTMFSTKPQLVTAVAAARNCIVSGRQGGTTVTVPIVPSSGRYQYKNRTRGRVQSQKSDEATDSVHRRLPPVVDGTFVCIAARRERLHVFLSGRAVASGLGLQWVWSALRVFARLFAVAFVCTSGCVGCACFWYSTASRDLPSSVSSGRLVSPFRPRLFLSVVAALVVGATVDPSRVRLCADSEGRRATLAQERQRLLSGNACRLRFFALAPCFFFFARDACTCGLVPNRFRIYFFFFFFFFCSSRSRLTAVASGRYELYSRARRLRR